MAKRRFKGVNRFSKMSAVNAVRLLVFGWLASMLLVVVVTVWITQAVSGSFSSSPPTPSHKQVAKKRDTPVKRETSAEEAESASPEPQQSGPAATATQSNGKPTARPSASKQTSANRAAAEPKPATGQAQAGTPARGESPGASLITEGRQSRVPEASAAKDQAAQGSGG